MMSIIPLIVTLAAAKECNVNLHLVQVQDTTGSFFDSHQDENGGAANGELLREFLEKLQEKFTSVHYGLATYSDKQAPVVGYGAYGDGWWSQDNFLKTLLQPDHCYQMALPINESLALSAETFSQIVPTNGKDFFENGYDALYRAAGDPVINWPVEDTTDGTKNWRVALLITDDGSHEADAPADPKRPRNMNHESFYYGGPITNYVQGVNETTGCDMEYTIREVNPLNNTNYAMLPKSHPPDYGYGDERANSCWGDLIAVSGATSSLKGALGFYEYTYGYGTIDRANVMYECYDSLDDCHLYDYFLRCCTVWGVSRDRCDESALNQYGQPSQCGLFGGNYYRCHPEQDGYTLAFDHQKRFSKCVDDSAWSEAEQKDEPNANFWRGLPGVHSEADRQTFRDKILAIHDYPYNDTVHDKDCSTFEYPNPRDSRYINQFVSNKIQPFVAIQLPSNKISIDDSSHMLESYDSHALRWSSDVCPGLEWDPWTTFMCDSRNFPYFKCYTPLTHEQLFLGERSKDASLYEPDTAWWIDNKCTTEECAAQWWEQCADRAFDLDESTGIKKKTFQPEIKLDELFTAIVDWLTQECPQ